MIRTPVAIGDTLTLFGTEHQVVMAGIAVVAIALSLLLRLAGDHARRTRRAVCGSLAGLLGVALIVEHTQKIVTGIWSVQESLPLHLCDIGLFVTVLALIGAASHGRPRGPSETREPTVASSGRHRSPDIWQWLFELAYFWGLGGTVQAVLTPDIDETFPDLRCMRYFTAHGAIIIAVLVMTIGLRMRPWRGAVVRVWLATLVLAIPVMLIDWLLGANYMYLCGPPAHPSLFDYFGRWPRSLLSLAVVATVLILLCYAPFWVIDRWRARRPTEGTSA